MNFKKSKIKYLYYFLLASLIALSFGAQSNNNIDNNKAKLTGMPVLQSGKWKAPALADNLKNPIKDIIEASKKGKKIFAYLKGGIKGVQKVLQILKGTLADVLVYAPGLPLAQVKRFQTKRLVIAQEIFNLKKVCKECNLVICHAGHATVARALLEGIPVVMLPTQVEQFLMSANVVRFGAGTMVNHHDKNPDYAGAIRRALKRRSIKRKAEEFAAHHADFDQQKQIADIVNRIEELVTPVS